MDLGLLEPPVVAFRVKRWPTEIPLLVLVSLVSLCLWIFLVVSIIGVFYAVLFGMFFFVSHLAFIAHLRGSAVRVTADQLPDLNRRVEELALQIGLARAPDAYVMQAGGLLNALATKFMRSSFIVLYSDLLDACGDNLQARDMIIAHELGHLKAGHLRWRWFLMPGLLTPFVGQAYSQAREYTCDRYGMAVCSDRTAALRGLAILAAGGVYGPRIDLGALARQGRDLDTVWMTVGRWLATHPPLVHRMAALEPSLAGQATTAPARVLGALTLVAVLVVAPFLFLGLFAIYGAKLMHRPPGLAGASSSGFTSHSPIDFGEAKDRAERDLKALADAVEAYRTRTGHTPQNQGELYEAWSLAYPRQPAPTDPFDGERYGYAVSGEDYHLWSSGINSKDPSDDIFIVSKQGVFR